MHRNTPFVKYDAFDQYRFRTGAVECRLNANVALKVMHCESMTSMSPTYWSKQMRNTRNHSRGVKGKNKSFWPLWIHDFYTRRFDQNWLTDSYIYSLLTESFRSRLCIIIFRSRLHRPEKMWAFCWILHYLGVKREIEGVMWRAVMVGKSFAHIQMADSRLLHQEFSFAIQH